MERVEINLKLDSKKILRTRGRSVSEAKNRMDYKMRLKGLIR